MTKKKVSDQALEQGGILLFQKKATISSGIVYWSLEPRVSGCFVLPKLEVLGLYLSCHGRTLYATKNCESKTKP